MLTRDFFLGGNAIFTVKAPLQRHRTYRVRRVAFKDGRVCYFADLLTGPDNERSYTYLGRVIESTGFLKATEASTLQGSVVWEWAQEALRCGWASEEPDGLEVMHAGRCSRCGRTLTDPQSLETGIGPVCLARGSE